MPDAAGLLQLIGLLLGASLVGVLSGLGLVRRRLVLKVKTEFGAENVLLTTTARLAPLMEGARTVRRPETGSLMLLKNGLYFHSWFGNREFFVSGPSITYIGVADTTAGRRIERAAVVLKFLNQAGKEDGVYLRLLSPDHWVGAIKTHLIARPV
jgi:hypothetical protein